MSLPLLRGVITALVTPFHEDGSLDLPSYMALIDDQLAMGVRGLVPCGTTGEASTLSTEEHLHVVKTCVQHVNRRVPVVAGAGSNDTKKAIELHGAVSACGVDAVLHVTPWYNKPTQEGLYRHYRAVADSADSQVVLYNVPGRTGVDLLPDTIARLAKDDKKFIGVKDATGSIQRTQDILNALHAVHPPQPFSVLSGDDGNVLSLVALGGHGVISVTSHVCGKEMQQMIDAFHEGDVLRAQDLSRKTSPLSSLLFFRSNPLPVKTALAMRKVFLKAHFRLPMCALDDADARHLQGELKRLGWLA
jgi:4-hydroxy-tetrahydrodipicolinate synthase